MLGILGTTALLLAGGPDDTWGKPRERAVLATLLVHANETVPAERLVSWVWPHDKPSPLQPGPTFDTYVARIRRTLARLPSPPELRVSDAGYQLTVDPARVDLYRFRSLLAEARRQDGRHPARVVELVEGALWLWRGLPLADLTTRPAMAWRAQVMRDDWLGAHTVRVRALLDLDRVEDATAALDELQADFPDDLDLAHLRLTALYRRHRFAEATGYFLTRWHRLRADGAEETAQLLREHHNLLAASYPAPLLPQPTEVPHRLPDDVPDFVGRRDELAGLDAGLAAGTAGVVVLDGPGGVGKTTLAVHWAHRVRAQFPDGELFVNLRGFTERDRVDPAAVVDDFLGALGQPPQPGLDQRQRERLLRVLLADRRVLVVLDNVHDTTQIRRLLELLPSCLVVVTSRRRLSLPGARRIPIQPLGVETAALLLSVRAHGRIQDAARLSTFCGGLPLLLSVLAGQLAGTSSAHLGDLVTRLDRRRLLAAVGKGGDLALPGESCLTWSYQALAAPERRLFRLLALHPGTDISAEAAYACDGRTPSETIKSLMCLVAAHLLEPSAELDRFGRHDVLAEFAARCLDRDEPPEHRQAAWERLLDTYIASATSAARLRCPDRDAGYDAGRQVEGPPADGPGVVFADADEAAAWFARERCTLAAVVRHAHDRGSHEYVPRLAAPVAALLADAGGTVESRAIRQLAVESARATGDRVAEGTALYRLGTAHMLVPDHEGARRCLTDAAALVPPAVSLFDHLGRLALLRGEPGEALGLYHRAVALAEADLAATSWLQYRIGQALRVADRAGEALVHLGTARATAASVGERAAEAASLAELGAIHHDLGDCSVALAYCEEALTIAETIPDLASAASICVTLSTIGCECRWFDTAVGYSRRAVELLRGTQDLGTQARVLAAHGDALHHSGEPHEAGLMWELAADLYDHAGLRVLANRLRGKVEMRRNHGSAPPARAESPARELLEPPMPAIRHHGATVPRRESGT